MRDFTKDTEKSVSFFYWFSCGFDFFLRLATSVASIYTDVATELRGCTMPRYALNMTNAMVTKAENDEKIIVLNV